MSRSQTKRPRDAARLATRHDDAAPASTATQGAPAPDQNSCPPDHLGTAGANNSSDSLVPIGVGFDTSRYGHYAAFLRADLQPAAADLLVIESALGYQQLRERFDALASKHAGHVHFHMRIDVAGCYADNLLAFLPALPHSKTISCGDPERNKNYRVALFGSKKSDPVEAHACARFAITEKPKATPTLTPAMRTLGHIASRLESQARQNTRVLNQLHNLLARTFPEFALLVKDLGTGWVVTVLERYPSAAPSQGETQPQTQPAAAENPQAAGHKNPARPERSVVTAACGTSSVPEAAAAGNGATHSQEAHRAGRTSDLTRSPDRATNSDLPLSQPAVSPWLDFTHVKSQLPIQRVLEHLDLFTQFRGRGSQWRGPCPVHGQGKGRTFSVHLEQNVFQCFHAKCAIKGNVIDLWAAIKGLKLRTAALELVTLFNLEPAPRTEKGHG